MARGGFDYSQFKEFYNNIKQMEKGHRKFIEDFLLEQALRLLAKTKKRTPVDTGDLRNAWYLSGVARRGDDVMINIINPKLYASWVEYGHRQEVGRYVPAIGKRLVNPWVEGRFMCTISMQEIEREIPKRFQSSWKKYAESLLGR